MAINLLFDRVIDYSVEDLINLNVTGNILVTRDANTPAGDPVVVNLSNLADVQALSRIVVENDATVVAGGGLASVGAIRLRTHSQKMTVAARQMAEKKTVGHLS